jgi:hypothetical protein
LINLASPPRFIDYNQLMEANRNAQNLQLAHEIVFNKDFQLQLPEYEKGRYEITFSLFFDKKFFHLVSQKKFMIQCIQHFGMF